MKSKSTCIKSEDFPCNEMNRCKIFKWEVVLGASNVLNIACLMHDKGLCQIDLTMTNQTDRQTDRYLYLT